MTASDSDSLIRAAAFEQVRRLLATHDQLTHKDIAAGFIFGGVRVPLVNPQRGIFKPRGMKRLLSIRTVVPRAGGPVWYDDQRIAHRQIYEGEETIEYAFMGDDPRAPENQWLKAAMEERTPVIYFLGVAPGLYEALQPAFIVGWNPASKSVRVAFSEERSLSLEHQEFPSKPAERRYALRLVKQRLHQSSFRQAVIDAYQRRCALSGLPEPLLLDAAHIVSDGHELMGQPVIQNGIPLSKLHHAPLMPTCLGSIPIIEFTLLSGFACSEMVRSSRRLRICTAHPCICQGGRKTIRTETDSPKGLRCFARRRERPAERYVSGTFTPAISKARSHMHRGALYTPRRPKALAAGRAMFDSREH